MIGLFLLSGFRSITRREGKLFDDIEEIASNVKQLKLNAESFSSEMNDIISERVVYLKNLLDAKNIESVDKEAIRELIEFQDLANLNHIQLESNIEFSILHLISWIVAIKKQIKELIVLTRCSREVAFKDGFSLTANEFDSLSSKDETNISSRIGISGIKLFLKFPKASKEIFYMTLMIGKTEFDLDVIENDLTNVVKECVEENLFNESRVEISELNPGASPNSKCGKAILASMGRVYVQAIKDLIITESYKQLNGIGISEKANQESKTPKGGDNQDSEG